jgi:hypothetical protein
MRVIEQSLKTWKENLQRKKSAPQTEEEQNKVGNPNSTSKRGIYVFPEAQTRGKITGPFKLVGIDTGF